MTVEIVRYNKQHADGVRDLIVPIQREEFGIAITYEEQPDLQDVEAFYRRGCGDFWVALAGDRVVGSIALIDIGNRQSALRKMFVHADHRGRDKGVAQGLLDTLMAHARTRDVADVYLGTTSKFLAAHRFYEKTGFDLIDEADLPEAFPRMAVDTRFYRRRLS